MRIFNTFVNLLLLLVTPSFLIYPKGATSFAEVIIENTLGDTLQVIPFEKVLPLMGLKAPASNEVKLQAGKEVKVSSYNYRYSADITYDEILDLLHAIEDDRLEEPSDPREIARINKFIAGLAKEGILEEDSEIRRDIDDLLSEDYALSSASINTEYQILPALMKGDGLEAVLCKKPVKKAWQKTKKFVKKHKKEIIIGAVVVVATTVIIVAVVAAASASAAAGAAAAGAGSSGGSGIAGVAAGAAAAAANSDKDKRKEKSQGVASPLPEPPSSASSSSSSIPTLQEVIDRERDAFRGIAKTERLFEFASPPGHKALSIEETGRPLGALLAHEGLQNTKRAVSNSPALAAEAKSLGNHPFFQNYKESKDFGHLHVNSRFGTDYSYLYQAGAPLPDYTTLAYQTRGEKALETGCYRQAVGDLTKAIDLHPESPLPYLHRGVANLQLGQYEKAIEDYKKFDTIAPPVKESFYLGEFAVAFAKAVPRGAVDSGKALGGFVADVAVHPIRTCQQTWDALQGLASLVGSSEWESVSKALVPEIHELVTQWNTKSSTEKGDLSGYVMGKYGADILIPGAIGKAIGTTVKGAEYAINATRGLRTAEELYALEVANALGDGTRIAHLMEEAQRAASVGEKVGRSAEELAQLKYVGKLEDGIRSNSEQLLENTKAIQKVEKVVNNDISYISQDPALLKSLELFKKAEESLKQYKQFLPERRCRNLIRQAGVPTFPRPAGVPRQFKVKITNTGAGMKYVHPTENQTYVRVMPGKSHSPWPHQQKPYVIYMKNGKTLDKYGNVVNKKSPEAHIPIEEFVYTR